MKKKNYLFYLSVSLILAITTVGCGKKGDDDQPMNGVVTNPTVNSSSVVPVGTYYVNGQTLPCPSGYIQSGNQCIQNTNPATACTTPGYAWNGTACAPSNLNCNPSQWNGNGNWQFNTTQGGCTYPYNQFQQQYQQYSPHMYQNYQQQYCQQVIWIGSQQYCMYYYTTGSPYGYYNSQGSYHSDYYWNGYGWVRTTSSRSSGMW